MHYLETISLPSDLSAHSEIIDVRSPSEFEIDHIPGAINLPVLDDQQRVTIGTLYKKSPFEARKLGAALVSKNAAKHLEGHLSGKDFDYAPLLYCWRGGMRSRSLTHILSSIGWKAKLLNGGYRAFRKFVVENLEQILTNPELKLIILSGLTGVGKTRMLHALERSGKQTLNLEGLANHKGSLLGSPPKGGQPSQKHFETQLWHTLSKFDTSKRIWTEAESNRIGNIHCPPPLWKKLSQGKLVQLNLDIDERIQLLREDYSHFGDNPSQLIELLNILRRLRGNDLVDRWQQQITNEEWPAFLKSILLDHYDLSYRRPEDSKSIYSAPSTTVDIESASQESYDKAAQQLIQLPL